MLRRRSYEHPADGSWNVVCGGFSPTRGGGSLFALGGVHVTAIGFGKDNPHEIGSEGVAGLGVIGECVGRRTWREAVTGLCTGGMCNGLRGGIGERVGTFVASGERLLGVFVFTRHFASYSFN